MSGYVKSHEFQLTFDGDTVTVRARPIEQGDLFRLRAVAVRGRAEADTTPEMMEAMTTLVKKSVESIAGLYDAGGNPVTIEEVTSVAYFATLVAQIGSEIFRRAQPANP